MKAKQLSLILCSAVVLALFSFGQVYAKELVKVTIAGPGLNSEIELTDTQSLEVFRELGFAAEPYQPASVDTEPYFEFRIAVGDGSDIVATGIYHYFPALNNHPSYIYNAPGINSWSSRDGQYFLVPEETDGKLQDLLDKLGASLRNTAIRVPAKTILWLVLWIILGGCLYIGAGRVVSLKRTQ
jgi:hypothetical protein